MALHAARHGFSAPLHGIVLGKSTPGAEGGIEVVDAVPVCHEVPTKPVVDMALRLTEAHLQTQKGMEGVRIVGWYTANARAASEEPNAPACRIAASMAEGAGEEFLLLVVSTKALVDCTLPICTVYEKGSSRAFAHKVDSDRVSSTGPNNGGEILSKALQQLPSSEYESDVAGGGKKGSLAICDFVDHLEDGGKGDWLGNAAVKEFVESFR